MKRKVIEHDGSLSRADTYFGDNSRFNATIWAETRSYFEGDTISVAEAARARAARLKSAKAGNPQYDLPDETASLFETALYLLAFGNGTDEARRGWVEILFGEFAFTALTLVCFVRNELAG